MGYQPGTYHGDALVIRGKIRPLLHTAEPDLGWSQWIDGQLRVVTIPGRHTNLFDQDNIANLAGEILVAIRGA